MCPNQAIFDSSTLNVVERNVLQRKVIDIRLPSGERRDSAEVVEQQEPEHDQGRRSTNAGCRKK